MIPHVLGHHVDRRVPAILNNLERTIASARRLRGHPACKDTLTYRGEFLQVARHLDPVFAQREQLDAAILALEGELAERPV